MRVTPRHCRLFRVLAAMIGGIIAIGPAGGFDKCRRNQRRACELFSLGRSW